MFHLMFSMSYVVQMVSLATFAPMKLLAFILSFLMIGLSALPCADEDFMAGSNQTGPALSKQHDQHDEHDDACSPFCHCTCCASFSINHIPFTSSSLIITDARSYSSYLPGIIINYSLPVWQPPKIG